jgi:hypothetical protein
VWQGGPLQNDVAEHQGVGTDIVLRSEQSMILGAEIIKRGRGLLCERSEEYQEYAPKGRVEMETVERGRKIRREGNPERAPGTVRTTKKVVPVFDGSTTL